MSYFEFKMSLIKSSWIANCEVKIELDIDKPLKAIAHRHHLFVDDETGLACGNGWNLSWEEMEKLVDEGKWENYPDNENEEATIMDVDGTRYRIWLLMPQRLDSLL